MAFIVLFILYAMVGYSISTNEHFQWFAYMLHSIPLCVLTFLLSDENVKIMTTTTIFEATNNIYITIVRFNRFHLECEMPNRLQNPK